MAKILFINPVIREEDVARHVPYGMALMVSIANNGRHKVQVFDANAWRPTNEQLIDVIKLDNWDVIATGGITTTYGYVKKIVKYSKTYSPKSIIVLGGGLITSMPHDMMKFLPEVDIGIIGEAFETLPEIMKMIDKNEMEWKSIDGIVWRDTNGKSHLTGQRHLITNLDILPYPAWDMFPLETYFKNSSILMSEEAMHAKRRLDINTSFGCSLICKFCFHLGLIGEMEYMETDNGTDVKFTYNRNIRWNSPQYIVNMVKYMRKKFGIDFVSFLDENLMTMNMATRGKWIPEICDLWIKEGLQPRCIAEGKPHKPDECDGVHWGGTSHAAFAKPEILRKMHQAGCTYLDYGLESFSDRILKSVGKGSTASLNERAIKITMEAGIRPIPNQIIGFPDEFFDSIYDDMTAWERMGVVVKPFFATAYPGSNWYYKYKNKIIEQYNGDLEAFLLDLGDATKITAVICENFNAVELLGLREMMVNGQINKIRQYEKEWRKIHGEPKIERN